MTVLWILAGVLTLNVAFVVHRLWITRHRSPAEERAIRRAALTARLEALYAAPDYIHEGDR